jgi:hypothetical protein
LIKQSEAGNRCSAADIDLLHKLFYKQKTARRASRFNSKRGGEPFRMY